VPDIRYSGNRKSHICPEPVGKRCRCHDARSVDLPTQASAWGAPRPEGTRVGRALRLGGAPDWMAPTGRASIAAPPLAPADPFQIAPSKSLKAGSARLPFSASTIEASGAQAAASVEHHGLPCAFRLNAVADGVARRGKHRPAGWPPRQRDGARGWLPQAPWRR
jgi:hypothetical protein